MSKTTRSLSQRLGLGHLKPHLRQTSLNQIQRRQLELVQGLEDPTLSWWEWMVLTGQLRELNAAQRLVETLFSTAERPTPLPVKPEEEPFPSGRTLAIRQATRTEPTGDGWIAPAEFQTIKAILLDRLVAKLAQPFPNQTETPLELDILRPAKQQELCLIVLRQFEALLDELRFSQVTRSQLQAKPVQLLQDLWHNATIDFLGKYRMVSVEPSEAPTTELVPPLLQERAIVSAAILERIPLFDKLLDHLLFHSDLWVDQQRYPVGSSEAILQGEVILSNVILQVSNAVLQPLINRFASVYELRTDFFDRRWLSTRDIERFRNALSWKYRVQQWFVEPTDIFESQHRLIVFGDIGLQFRTLYAPRDQELKTLSGVPFITTLALETRDAIAPPLQATLTFIGRGVVFLLTHIIGRSIGLVGRGVLQGVGYVKSEVRSRS